MEPHMIENELFSYLFVIGINHVGFICLLLIIVADDLICYILSGNSSIKLMIPQTSQYCIKRSL